LHNIRQGKKKSEKIKKYQAAAMVQTEMDRSNPGQPSPDEW